MNRENDRNRFENALRERARPLHVAANTKGDAFYSFTHRYSYRIEVT
jgi:hypothetical protein